MTRARLIAVLVATAAVAGTVAVLAGGDDAPDGRGAGQSPAAPRGEGGGQAPGRDRTESPRPAPAPAEGARPRRPLPDPDPEGLVAGIGDQKPETFTDPRFTRDLHVRRSRYNTPWNSVFTEPDRLATWLAATRREGIEPVVAFERARGDQCPADPCTLPSVAAYRRAFRTFRRRFPWVRVVQPWNEANSGTQPTGRAPARAAAFYRVVRRACRSCLVPAADVLDSANMERWVRGFLAALRRPPRLWGLHNYSDTNRFRDQGTRRLLALVPGEVWITESGGVVSFTTADGRVVFPPDERRAARATRFMFRLAIRHRSRIRRVYLYHWSQGHPGERFDAGLVRTDGTPRPALAVARRYLRMFR